MKKFLVIVSIIFAGTLFFSSCEKEGAQLYDVVVSLQFPDGYTADDMSNITIKLTNQKTGSELTELTDALGQVNFRIEGGTYTTSASYSTDEFAFNGIIENMIVSSASLEFSIDLVWVPLTGGLIFKEIYYTGSKTPELTNYYADQFHEIYNNSGEVLYLDGLCIGVMQPTSSSPSDWVDENGNLMDLLPITYMTWIWPGDGDDYPIQPWTSIVLAQDAIDHQTDPAGNPASPVNLSGADWETYFETSGKDTDTPGVPNLTSVYSTTATMYDWLSPVMGGAIVLFRLPTGVDYLSFANNPENFMTRPGSTSTTEYLMIHKDYVVDAVEEVRVEEDKRYKRLPVSVDAGMVWCSGTYISKSIRRKVKSIIDGNVIYQDTNNSTEDFLGDQDPTPGVHPSVID